MQSLMAPTLGATWDAFVDGADKDATWDAVARARHGGVTCAAAPLLRVRGAGSGVERQVRLEEGLLLHWSLRPLKVTAVTSK